MKKATVAAIVTAVALATVLAATAALINKVR